MRHDPAPASVSSGKRSDRQVEPGIYEVVNLTPAGGAELKRLGFVRLRAIRGIP